MKQLVVTVCDKWVAGQGFTTQNHILDVEEVETDHLITCDDLDPLDDETFGDVPDSDDYLIRVYIYNSAEDMENDKPYDRTQYWMFDYKEVK